MANQLWLMAQYHFPSTYSIRSPASSPYHSQTLPTPNSTTAKLALIRKSLEIWGQSFTRNVLFSEIISAEIFIEPPASIGISLQRLKALKNGSQSLMHREFCHAKGNLVIYAKVNEEMREEFEEMFRSICYWGRTDSFTTCISVKVQRKPNLSHVIKSIDEIPVNQQINDTEFGIALQMNIDNLSWEDLTNERKMTRALQMVIFSFGLEVIEQHGTSRLLCRRSLE